MKFKRISKYVVATIITIFAFNAKMFFLVAILSQVLSPFLNETELIILNALMWFMAVLYAIDIIFIGDEK